MCQLHQYHSHGGDPSEIPSSKLKLDDDWTLRDVADAAPYLDHLKPSHFVEFGDLASLHKNIALRQALDTYKAAEALYIGAGSLTGKKRMDSSPAEVTGIVAATFEGNQNKYQKGASGHRVVGPTPRGNSGRGGASGSSYVKGVVDTFPAPAGHNPLRFAYFVRPSSFNDIKRRLYEQQKDVKNLDFTLLRKTQMELAKKALGRPFDTSVAAWLADVVIPGDVDKTQAEGYLSLSQERLNSNGSGRFTPKGVVQGPKGVVHGKKNSK